jgi:hypothetical protein
MTGSFAVLEDQLLLPFLVRGRSVGPGVAWVGAGFHFPVVLFVPIGWSFAWSGWLR